MTGLRVEIINSVEEKPIIGRYLHSYEITLLGAKLVFGKNKAEEPLIGLRMVDSEGEKYVALVTVKNLEYLLKLVKTG